MEEIPRPEAADARTIEARPRAHARGHRQAAGRGARAHRRPARGPRGRAAARARPAGASPPTPGEHAIVGSVEDPAELVAAAGDRPVLAHDAKALGEVPRQPRLRHRVAAYLLDPARRGYPLDELAEERGIAAVSDDAGAPRRARRRARHPPARADPRARARRPADRDRAPADPRAARDREGRRQARHAPAGGVATRIRADAAQLEREIWELAGEEFMIGSPQQLAEVLFVKLGLSRKRRGKTGFSHRRARAAGDPLRARDHPQDRALPRADQARADLPRRAARLHRRRRAHAHDVPADQRRHRPAVVDQPEPAEHPDPHRDRPRDPRLLHRRARQRAAQRRLLAGRAARARAHRRRGRAARDLQARRGRAHRDGVGGVRAPARAARRRHALEGQDGQLRDRLRPQRLRARRPPADRAGGGAGVHRPLPGALPGRRAVHEGRRRRRPSSTATSRRCSAAAARSPRSARATGRRASSASGSRSTPSSRARRRTSSRSRWCARTRRSPPRA